MGAKMNHKYTFITLFAALIFIVGSMAGMSFILRTREKQLLGQSGGVMMNSPVLAWQRTLEDDDREGEKAGENDILRPQLTMEQMEDAIRSWNDRKGEILHNPVEGQLSMEEAVAAGEEWLVKMGFWKADNADAEVYNVKATLSMGYTDTNAAPKTQLEPYYSFWTIQFANENKYAILYLNAVTGEVWGAEINLYDGGVFSIQTLYENLELFVELAGFQASEQVTVANQQSNQTILAIEGSSLCAKATQYSLAIAEAGYYETGKKGTQKSHDKIIYQFF